MAEFKTNLNQFPYGDDFEPADNYYKYLFKPSVAVQVRELNGIQSLLQNQISTFGDNVYKRGTILSGVNLSFHKPYRYVKLLDTQTNGFIVNPSDYVGNFAINETNQLKAFILNYADGFESTDPDLKTIYVRYVNSGNTAGSNTNTDSFAPDDTLKIVKGSRPINDVTITTGGAGLSNSDLVVFVSQMLVNVTSGSFIVGDDFHQTDTNANGVITAIDTTTFPGKILVQVKPKDAHLTNNSVNAAAWSFSRYSPVQNIGATATGKIEYVYGAGATANVVTDSSGTATNIQMDAGGTGYAFVPYTAIKTTNTSVVVSGIDLTAQNYRAQVRVQNDAQAVGNGYAFSVTDGYIYDVGTFLRVEEQTIIVSKYNPTPNAVAVGFSVQEEIIDYNKDTSLLDNIISENESAPGADRLKLTPTLALQTKEQAATNSEFLTLVEWNNGKPYKQNQTSQFSALGDAMAQQAYDQSGNFVMDAFQVATESPANSSLDGTYFTMVVDPGQAYINGRKVQTLSNYKINLKKGLDTKIANNTISLNYGNYVRVNEVSGGFDTANAAQISLRSQPTDYISNSDQYSTGTITPYGREVGTARVRAFIHESGSPGDANAIYRAYLFDVKLNAGESFDDVRALYYNHASYDAVADAVLEYSPQRQEFIAELKDKNKNQLLFSAGVSSLKNSNTSTYIYRTTGIVNTIASSAQTAIDLSAGSEYLPYGTDRELSFSELREIVMIPVFEDLQFTPNFTGTVDINTANGLVTGAGTNFFSDFEIGDYIYTIDGGSEEYRRITNIMSATSLRVDAPFSSANATANFTRVFPQNIPMPYGYREGLTANVDVTGQILTLDVAHSNGLAVAFTLAGATANSRISYNVERRNTQSSLKTANRGKYVKIAVANNADGLAGPWCLGVPDVFRLRAVYHHTDSTVNTNSSDITSNFYIDHNQNSNYLNHGFLYSLPSGSFTATANSWLLVCFDYFTNDDTGYYDARSYRRTSVAADIATSDARSFTDLSTGNNLAAAISTEIPEVYSSDDRYYDLINQFDFRPSCDATATPSGNVGSAPINPTQTVTFTGLQKFPTPDSFMTTQVEHYVGRVDDVYISETGNIYVLKGIPDINPRRRLQSNHPKDSLRLQMINVPPYPNFVQLQGHDGNPKLQTRVANEKITGLRAGVRTISPILNTRNLQTSQPMVYTMEDIGNLERRIADLEYYVSLSVLETSMSNKVIPSSIDRTLNRFKYGFFADDYSTDVYSDGTNPQYAASIEAEGDMFFGSALNPLEPKVANPDNSTDPTNRNSGTPLSIVQNETNRAVPLKHIWGVRHLTQNPLFIDEEIISQLNTTDRRLDGSVNRNDSCVQLLSNNAIAANSYLTSINRFRTPFYPEGITGTITLYFDFINDNIAYDYGAQINVYDPNGVVLATSNSSANTVETLTDNDKVFLQTDEGAAGFYAAIATSNVANSFVRSGINADYGRGIGKLTFNSTSSGQHIIETTTTFTGTNHKSFVVWPSLLAAGSSVINEADCQTIPQDPTDPPLPPSEPSYIGTLQAGSLSLTQWTCSNWFRINDSNYRAFVLTATGLKPYTIHKMYMDTEEWPFVVTFNNEDFKNAYDPRFLDRGATTTYQGEGDTAKSPSLFTNFWSGFSGKTVDATPAEIEPYLVFSVKNKANELVTFLKQARNRMQDENGNFLQDSVLTTDGQGKLKFLVFFPLDIAGWFSQDFNAYAYTQQAYSGPGTFQMWGKTFTQTSGPYAFTAFSRKIKPTGGSSGYSAISLKNTTGESVAERIFANRTPYKVIPYDPKGNI